MQVFRDALSAQVLETTMKKPPESLGQFEQLVLTAVMSLRDRAYGSQIFEEVCELAGKEMNLGSTYVALDRLETKGLVKSSVEPGTPERGGKRRRFYHMEDKGLEALTHSVETAARVSESFYEAWRLGKWKPKRAK